MRLEMHNTWSRNSWMARYIRRSFDAPLWSTNSVMSIFAIGIKNLESAGTIAIVNTIGIREVVCAPTGERGARHVVARG